MECRSATNSLTDRHEKWLLPVRLIDCSRDFRVRS